MGRRAEELALFWPSELALCFCTDYKPNAWIFFLIVKDTFFVAFSTTIPSSGIRKSIYNLVGKKEEDSDKTYTWHRPISLGRVPKVASVGQRRRPTTSDDAVFSDGAGLGRRTFFLNLPFSSCLLVLSPVSLFFFTIWMNWTAQGWPQFSIGFRQVEPFVLKIPPAGCYP